MTKETAIKLIETKKVRSVWDSEAEKWYFSIIDVIEALTGTDRPRKYWSDLKAKLKKESSELSEKIGQLKLAAEVETQNFASLSSNSPLILSFLVAGARMFFY